MYKLIVLAQFCLLSVGLLFPHSLSLRPRPLSAIAFTSSPRVYFSGIIALKLFNYRLVSVAFVSVFKPPGQTHNCNARGESKYKKRKGDRDTDTDTEIEKGKEKAIAIYLYLLCI